MFWKVNMIPTAEKTIDEKKSEIIKKMTGLPTWEDRYRQIIFYGKKLKDAPDTLKQEENLVRGCLSQVWFTSKFEEGKVIYFADSDSAVVKGIAGLLVYLYSNSTPDEIINMDPGFLKEVGIDQHLSSNRRNGLVNMLERIFETAKSYQ